MAISRSRSKRETDCRRRCRRMPRPSWPANTYCAAFWHSYGFETVALRYFNVFGPRQDPSGPYAAVIPLFIKAILAGQQPTIYGDGQQTRDFCNVRMSSGEFAGRGSKGRRGQVFNVGCGTAISLLDLLAGAERDFGDRA